VEVTQHVATVYGLQIEVWSWSRLQTDRGTDSF